MKFKILHTNDIHSRFENFAKISTKIKQLKNDFTLVLDAGDYHDFKDVMLQGTKGTAGAELLLEAGYDAIAVGNNEGFEGLDVMNSMISNTSLPFLSSNLIKLDGTPIEGLNRSIIVQKSGVRFLIIGLSPNYKEFFNLLGLDSLDYKEQLQKEMDEHRGQYDVCILLSHLGLKTDTDIASTIDGIDLIIGGHSHDLLDEPVVVNNTILHMAGCYGEHVGILEFEYDGTLKNVTGTMVNVLNEKMDENILTLMTKNKQIANANLGSPLYHIEKDMWHDVVEENPMTNLLADALKDLFKCEIGLINSGIMNSGIRRGDVSFKKLIEICPSPLNPTYIEIQGKHLKAALQQSLNPEICYQEGKGAGFRGRFVGRLHISGATIKHDGTSIQRITVNGEDLQDERYYTVATSDYLQRGSGYKDLANNQNESYKPEYLRLTLRDYLCKPEFLEQAYIDRWIRN